MSREDRFVFREAEKGKQVLWTMNNQKIKFRAWDGTRFFGPYTIKEIASEFTDLTERSCTADELVFQQFTGIFDKNGKEIYVGDIVKIIVDKSTFDYDREETMILPVMYSPSRGFKAYWGYENNNSECLYGSKIIGNIFENPEISFWPN